MVLRMKSALILMAATVPLVLSSCSSDSGTTSAGSGGRGSGGASGGSTGSGGRTAATGGTTGTGGAGSGGIGSGGSLGTGGAGVGGRGTGGAAGGLTGGNGAGGRGTGGAAAGGRGGGVGGAGGGLSLAQACTATCNTQKALAACTPDPTTCEAMCVGQPALTMRDIGQPCATEYTAMLRCATPLTVNRWTCSSDENVPIVVEGQCTAAVCAWACCATDLVVPTDIWARCMSTCP